LIKDEHTKDTPETPEVNDIPPQDDPVSSDDPGSPGNENTDAVCGRVDNAEECETMPEENAGQGTASANVRIAELEKQLSEMKDMYLRLMAEYDNYRKRTAREKESFYAMAKAETVERILPVYDNIERAVNNPTSDEAYKKGVEMIFQQLKDVFSSLGVREIEAEGAKFDPEKHNAVMHIEDDRYGENSVVEVFQRGFEIDGRVIRHSVVKVAN